MAESIYKLEIIEIIRKSFSKIIRNKTQVFFILLIPVALYIVLDIADRYIMLRLSAAGKDYFTLAQTIIFSTFKILLELLLIIIVAVNWHRHILLNIKVTSPFSIFKFSRREFNYVAWFLQLFGITILMFVIFVWPMTYLAETLIPDRDNSIIDATDLDIIIYIIPIYIMSRISLGLPAAAIDVRPELSSVFKLSKGNSWRLFLLVGVLPYFLSLITSLLEEMSEDLTTNVIYIICKSLLYVIVTIIEISLLSYCYKHLADIDDR